MKLLLRKHWDSLRSSFWFVPATMAACAVALALASVSLDEAVTYEWIKAQGWAYTGGAEGASLVLSTIAGSMITITGVVFSMTLVALSLASSQLGPRLLRNFMRDRMNQVVLGTFVATFVYCLVVLRTIRRADEVLFVPHISVTFGVLLALVGLGVLIYFIHHVSVSIQADEVVARVGKELMAEIDRLFPEESGEGGRGSRRRWTCPKTSRAPRARSVQRTTAIFNASTMRRLWRSPKNGTCCSAWRDARASTSWRSKRWSRPGPGIASTTSSLAS